MFDHTFDEMIYSKTKIIHRWRQARDDHREARAKLSGRRYPHLRHLEQDPTVGLCLGPCGGPRGRGGVPISKVPLYLLPHGHPGTRARAKLSGRRCNPSVFL